MKVYRTCPMCHRGCVNFAETYDNDMRPLTARPPEETPIWVQLACNCCGYERRGRLSREERGFED